MMDNVTKIEITQTAKKSRVKVSLYALVKFKNYGKRNHWIYIVLIYHLLKVGPWASNIVILILGICWKCKFSMPIRGLLS